MHADDGAARAAQRDLVCRGDDAISVDYRSDDDQAAACQLHAVLCDLVPGGIRREISAGKAAAVLGQVTPLEVEIGADSYHAWLPRPGRRPGAQIIVCQWRRRSTGISSPPPRAPSG